MKGASFMQVCEWVPTRDGELKGLAKGQSGLDGLYAAMAAYALLKAVLALVFATSSGRRPLPVLSARS